mmetsp:Transcript_52135/g.153876  ORF Transcript_52135/g.153876 Transcript_52135/m.153876 type:complete len:229 (+) Transcript_52135:553-1239(+)
MSSSSSSSSSSYSSSSDSSSSDSSACPAAPPTAPEAAAPLAMADCGCRLAALARSAFFAASRCAFASSISFSSFFASPSTLSSTLRIAAAIAACTSSSSASCALACLARTVLTTDIHSSEMVGISPSAANAWATVAPIHPTSSSGKDARLSGGGSPRRCENSYLSAADLNLCTILPRSLTAVYESANMAMSRLSSMHMARMSHEPSASAETTGPRPSRSAGSKPPKAA